jgi:hypothetical protein
MLLAFLSQPLALARPRAHDTARSLKAAHAVVKNRLKAESSIPPDRVPCVRA